MKFSDRFTWIAVFAIVAVVVRKVRCQQFPPPAQGQAPPYGYPAPAQGQAPPYGYPQSGPVQQPPSGYPAPGAGQAPPNGYPAPGTGQAPPNGYPAPGPGQQPQYAYSPPGPGQPRVDPAFLEAIKGLNASELAAKLKEYAHENAASAAQEGDVTDEVLSALWATATGKMKWKRHNTKKITVKSFILK